MAEHLSRDSETKKWQNHAQARSGLGPKQEAIISLNIFSSDNVLRNAAGISKNDLKTKIILKDHLARWSWSAMQALQRKHIVDTTSQ